MVDSVDFLISIGVVFGIFTVILFFRDIRLPKITHRGNRDSDREKDLRDLIEKAHDKILIVSGSGYAPIYNKLGNSFTEAFNRGVKTSIVICGNDISTKDGKNVLSELGKQNIIKLHKSKLPHRHFWVVDDSDVEIEEKHPTNSQERFVHKIVDSISANRRYKDKFNQILSTSNLVSEPDNEFTPIEVRG